MASVSQVSTPSTDATLASLWGALEPVGRVDWGGYRRFAWTSEDATLREWFAGEAAARGLEVVEDRAGNLWAWWGDPDGPAGPGVVLGSHLDSVPDGGAFDGPLGVVSAFAALDAYRAGGHTPARVARRPAAPAVNEWPLLFARAGPGVRRGSASTRATRGLPPVPLVELISLQSLAG